MKRRLLNLLTALSLLLCVAVVLLWVRSYRHRDHVRHATPTRHRGVVHFVDWTATTGGGRITLGRSLVRFPMDDGIRTNFVRGWEWTSYRLGHSRALTARAPTIAQRHGLHWQSTEHVEANGEVRRHVWVGFPLWAPAALLAAVPVARVYRHLRRHPAGHCPRCGYDLTGNVSGVCPECGRPSGGRPGA